MLAALAIAVWPFVLAVPVGHSSWPFPLAVQAGHSCWPFVLAPSVQLCHYSWEMLPNFQWVGGVTVVVLPRYEFPFIICWLSQLIKKLSVT